MIREIVRVDPERRSQWLLPSAIRVVPPAQMQHLLPVDPARPWQQGDLILGRVESVGMINRVQNVNRRGGIDYREAALFPGTVTVAVLAPRAGTSTCIAKVPPTPIDHLHLHGVGGQAGLVVPGTHHSALYRDPPTAIQVLAILAGPDQEPLNTRSFHSAIAECSAEPRPRTSRDPGLILVVGSDMDDGKTTTARRIIYSLRALGRPVVAGKPVGVGSLGDISSMYDAGASEVLDFSALGEPVTIGLPRERVLEIFHQIFNHLRAQVPPDGFVVLELADGIWYRETQMILKDELVRSLVTDVVFACHGILDADNGMAKLRGWGYQDKLRALSGKLGSSGVLRDLLPRVVEPHYPIFDALDYERSPAEVAHLFTRGAGG